MTEWVMVNGARIERSFLRENVSEARAYAWERTHWRQADDHGHCMVCNVALSGSDVCYHSEGGWLCQSSPECSVKAHLRDVVVVRAAEATP